MLKAIASLPLGNRHQQLTKQAQKLVGQTFYGTLMKQMHNSPFKSTLMNGGRGGEAFQPLMDQHLIDHMAAHGGGQKLVRNIVKHIERKEAARNKSASSPSTSPQENSTDENPFHNVRVHVAPGLRA